MAELIPLAWAFVRECPVPADIFEILLPGEEPKAAYATIRDSAIFTNRRLIAEAIL
ncbi:TPA: PH domain-containing protein [Streptococcus suis]|nr:PH domain-containing protein [Streptococcus suis]HEL1583566.1 PH domain-containing protein [Streptococcus suis]